MGTAEFIRELDALMERHKNDRYSSFDTRWRDVIADCKSKIQDMQTEIDKLERYIKELKNMDQNERAMRNSTDIDLPLAVLDAVGDMQ